MNVATLKSELSKYLEMVQQGKKVIVTSHGQEVAKIIPTQAVMSAPVNWKEFFKKYPPVKTKWKGESAESLIRKIREED